MIVINNTSEINLSSLTYVLDNMNINRLVIFSINLTNQIHMEKFVLNGDYTELVYIEIGVEQFIEYISENPKEFWDVNRDTLYVLRDGSYTDVKYILSQVGEFGLNLGRGGSQKSHIMSPLELRLSSYIMAMFDFNYRTVLHANQFNCLSKERYLPFIQNRKGKSDKKTID